MVYQSSLLFATVSFTLDGMGDTDLLLSFLTFMVSLLIQYKFWNALIASMPHGRLCCPSLGKHVNRTLCLRFRIFSSQYIYGAVPHDASSVSYPDQPTAFVLGSLKVCIMLICFLRPICTLRLLHWADSNLPHNQNHGPDDTYECTRYRNYFKCLKAVH